MHLAVRTYKRFKNAFSCRKYLNLLNWYLHNEVNVQNVRTMLNQIRFPYLKGMGD